MARTATLTQMRTRIRQLANVEGDTNITDAELTDLVNRHLAEVYDILVAAGPADYYAASRDVTTSRGVIAYALDADFLALVGGPGGNEDVVDLGEVAIDEIGRASCRERVSVVV